MTVQELMEKLSELPKNAVVVAQYEDYGWRDPDTHIDDIADVTVTNDSCVVLQVDTTYAHQQW